MSNRFKLTLSALFLFAVVSFGAYRAFSSGSLPTPPSLTRISPPVKTEQLAISCEFPGCGIWLPTGASEYFDRQSFARVFEDNNSTLWLTNSPAPAIGNATAGIGLENSGVVALGQTTLAGTLTFTLGEINLGTGAFAPTAFRYNNCNLSAATSCTISDTGVSSNSNILCSLVNSPPEQISVTSISPGTSYVVTVGVSTTGLATCLRLN